MEFLQKVITDKCMFLQNSVNYLGHGIGAFITTSEIWSHIYYGSSLPVSQSCSPPGISLTPSHSSAVDVIVFVSVIIPPDLISTQNVTSLLVPSSP